MGTYMRRLRKDAGYTMKKLGELVGVTESAIGQYETGKRKPEYDTLMKICRLLKCDAADLFRDEEEVLLGIPPEQEMTADDIVEEFDEELQILMDDPQTRALLKAGKGLTSDQIKAVEAIMIQMRGRVDDDN